MRTWNKAGEAARGNLCKPPYGSHRPPFHKEGEDWGRGERRLFNILLLNSVTCSSLATELIKLVLFVCCLFFSFLLFVLWFFSRLNQWHNAFCRRRGKTFFLILLGSLAGAFQIKLINDRLTREKNTFSLCVKTVRIWGFRTIQKGHRGWRRG